MIDIFGPVGTLVGDIVVSNLGGFRCEDFGATQDNLTAGLKREAFVETRLRNRACESHLRGPADRRVWHPPAAIVRGVRPPSRHRTEFSEIE